MMRKRSNMIIKINKMKTLIKKIQIQIKIHLEMIIILKLNPKPQLAIPNLDQEPTKPK